jgi:hypothetical protein
MLRTVVLIALLVSCTAKCVNEPPAPPPFNFRFVSEGCFGACPAYLLDVGSDGRAYLHVRGHIHEKGDFFGRVSPDEIRELVQLHRVLDVQVTRPIPDLRVVSLVIRDAAGQRTVRGTAAGPFDGGAPAPLLSFAEAMDSIVRRTQWSEVGGS